MKRRYPFAILPPWVIESQHGMYPVGTWGYRGTRDTKAAALACCRPDERVYNNDTGETIYPTDSVYVDHGKGADQ